MSENKPLLLLAPGDRIGNYSIRALIGRGKNTAVYRAYHPEQKREVALKILRSAAPQTPEVIAKFNEEVQAITTLKHPNIMRVFDHGVQAGAYYLIMELVEGTNLRDAISTHPTGLDPEETVRIFGQLASAVATAHDHGVVHGNIKPDNVLLDKTQRPVLTDFSLVCLGATVSREEGSGMATYLSPEQITQGTATAPADIYALGVLLYEILTGVVPFKGDTFEEVTTQHQNMPPVPPSQIRVNVDPRVDQVILKALSKKSDERFTSARDMLTAMKSEDVRSRYETVNLTRDSVQVQKSRAEIASFQRARATETKPETKTDPVKPLANPVESQYVWIIVAVIVVMILSVLIALIL
ncbi:MAG: serine/threonine protein kinase [Chloroflexi bacterium]|nr:serine/threonine protein kinase [Chloroflexota bacterium]